MIIDNALIQLAIKAIIIIQFTEKRLVLGSRPRSRLQILNYLDL